MSEDQGVTRVESGTVRCAGGAADPHEPIEFVLTGSAPAECPRCGRRFQRARPADVSPAVWPKER